MGSPEVVEENSTKGGEANCVGAEVNFYTVKEDIIMYRCNVLHFIKVSLHTPIANLGPHSFPIKTSTLTVRVEADLHCNSASARMRSVPVGDEGLFLGTHRSPYV